GEPAARCNGPWRGHPRRTATCRSGSMIRSVVMEKARRPMPSLLMVTTVPEMLYGFLLPFARHFRACGWRVDAMAQGVSSWPDCVQAFDRVWDMEWSRNPVHPRNMLVAPKGVRDLVAREGYDIVHVHSPVAAFVTRLALRRLRKQGKPRVIYTAHGFHFY